MPYRTLVMVPMQSYCWDLTAGYGAVTGIAAKRLRINRSRQAGKTAGSNPEPMEVIQYSREVKRGWNWAQVRHNRRLRSSLHNWKRCGRALLLPLTGK